MDAIRRASQFLTDWNPISSESEKGERGGDVVAMFKKAVGVEDDKKVLDLLGVVTKEFSRNKELQNKIVRIVNIIESRGESTSVSPASVSSHVSATPSPNKLVWSPKLEKVADLIRGADVEEMENDELIEILFKATDTSNIKDLNTYLSGLSKLAEDDLDSGLDSGIIEIRSKLGLPF